MIYIKKAYFYILGAVTGLLNGFFGSGGGLIAVPLLKRSGCEQKKAQASSIALTFPLTIISTVIYYFKGNADITTGLKYIPAGIIGALIGTFILKKISDVMLRKIFGIMLIISGGWMLIR